MSRTELLPATTAATLSERLAGVSSRPTCFDAFEAQRLVLAISGVLPGIAREPAPDEVAEPVRFTPVQPA